MIVPGSGLVKQQAEEKGWIRYLQKPDLTGVSLGVLCVWQ